jgi:hypothetical protein
MSERQAANSGLPSAFFESVNWKLPKRNGILTFC